MKRQNTACRFAAPLLLATTLLAGNAALAEDKDRDDGHGARASRCHLQSSGNEIKQIVYLQFDNVHFRRDIPNVPSDLEQMPHLLNFLKNQGTFLTNHHTPLISHTAVDFMTAISGLYGDRMGMPIGNSLRYYKPDGTTNPMGSFAYWTDPLDDFTNPNPPTDVTPEFIGKDGKTAPAPWVAFTRAGCDVGVAGIANIDLENTGLDLTTVFGAGSKEEKEGIDTPDKAAADFEAIVVHCAKGSPVCAVGGRPDLLPQEPGGYVGFQGLFGHVNVAPRITKSLPLTDLDGNTIQDSTGNIGFPGFDGTSATVTLSYVAHMLESGLPVVYGELADVHDAHLKGDRIGTLGPGEAAYEAQLRAYDKAFDQFFTRLKAENITTRNTLFIVTSDENDHFVGGAPSPANCDGVQTPCTFAQIGEIDGDLARLLFTQKGNKTPFKVHSDSAPAIYVTGTPATPIPLRTDPAVRQLERDMGGLTALNPISGKVDNLLAAMADPVEQKLLHMVTADPKRTPSFIFFANDNYFLFSTSPKSCATGSPCITLEGPNGFAWNHGDFQNEITNTWLGMAGPGVRREGLNGEVFSDHTDIRPTIMRLAGLEDDYDHDGRVLFEVLSEDALPHAVREHREVVIRLAQIYKQINAPRGKLGRETLRLSTKALQGDDATYTAIEDKIAKLTTRRDAIAAKMIEMLEDAAFDRKPIDVEDARELIEQAEELLETAKS